MFGNMQGAMPMGAGAGAIDPSTITPATPDNFVGQDLLGKIFGAIFNPDQTAQEMAKMGVTPEDLSGPKSDNHLAELMQKQIPPPGAGSLANTVNPPAAMAPVNPLVTQHDEGTPSISQLMQPNMTGTGAARPGMVPTNQPQPQPLTAQNVMGDLMKPIGQGAQSGIDLMPNPNFTSISDIISNLFGGMGNMGIGAPGAPSIAPAGGGNGGMPSQPTPMNAVPPMPVVPPVTASPGMPPMGVSPQLPMNPPVVPPAGTTTPTVADDYASGKIKSSVMGGAGGNAPDSQLKGNSIFNEFMGTIKAGGVTNPNALAAIAATTKSESGFDEKNFYGSWADPSQSGGKGTSGGAMSWRNERFAAMKDFVKANGGDPSKPSAALQAKFFLQEDPNLVAALNNAKSPEEAQTLMNNAWQFAGYDDPEHGEAARRIALARNFASTGDFGDLKGIIPAANAGDVAANAGTGGIGEMSLMDRLAAMGAALDNSDSGSGGKQDLNLPQAPSPVAPRPGQYAPDANVQKLMLMLLTGLSGGGANVPSIGALMSGRTG